MKYGTLTLLLIFFLANLYAQNFKSKITPYGSIRTGYFTSERQERNGSIIEKHELRLRAQVGLQYRVSEKLSFSARVAGRYSTAQEAFHFLINDHIIQGKDGLLLGEATIDELFVKYSFTDKLQMRAGRIQTKFELGGVPKKSLDRNNSPNTDINWTDGVHLKYSETDNWEAHLIVQYNSPEGSSDIRRKPLSFEQQASRISYYAGFQKTDKNDFWAQRELSATYIPKSVPIVGLQDNYKDLLALTGSLSADPRLGQNARFFFGTELGYMFNTPEKLLTHTGTSDAGTAGKFSFAATINLLDLYEKHNVGFLYGNIEDGWLISPDFASNMYAYEFRYQWKISKKLSSENRIRYRSDKYTQTDAVQKRRTIDLYFRFTYKF